MFDDLPLFTLPFVAHSLVLLLVALMRKRGVLYEYGQIPISVNDLKQPNSRSPETSLNALMNSNIGNDKDIAAKKIFRNQIFVVPLLRTTAVVPILFYVLLFFMEFATRLKVKILFEYDIVFWALLGFAVFCQILHIALRILSGFASHLIELHPGYSEIGSFSVVTGFGEVKR